MPAKSRAQQRFFGMVRAAQKGEMDSPSPEVAQAASSMKKSAVKDFASTKHKKLPEKKVEEEYFFEEYDVMDLTEEEIIDLIERKIPTSRRAQIARAIADRVPRLAPGLRMYAMKKDIEKGKTRSWSKADRARETGERYITSAPKNEGLTFQEFLAIAEGIREMSEAWYSGSSGYRTTASGRRVRRDEPDEAEQLRQSDEIARNPRVQAERRAGARARLKAKGKVPTKNGKPVFEEVIEYLYVNGYADTIEAAELIAENIRSDWFLLNTQTQTTWEEMIFEAIDWDKSQIGLTGQPVPKRKWSAAKQHEFEKKRREHLKKRLGEPGDSPMIQALRKKAKDTGNYAESYDEIIDEKYVKAMDSTGRGADRRAHTTDPSVRPTRRKPTPEKYKHSEAEFDSTLRSPSARKRKDERRQGVGGFKFQKKKTH